MAVNHHPEPARGADGRDQAYRMVAELLVGFRRIVIRGLQRVCGDSWLEAGCPRDVRDRILARQEAERGVDRFSAEGDDAFAYVNFADLADIVESVPGLAELLSPLAASPERLCANLRSLEEVRSKIAGIRPVSESEQVALAEMHLRLREKLVGARRRAHGEEPQEGLESAAAEASDTAGATPEPPPPARSTEPPATAATAPSPEPQRRPERTADRAAKSATATQGARGAGRQVVAPPAKRRPERLSVAASAGGPPKPHRIFDPVGAAVLDGAPTPVGLVRVEEGDLSVLRDLRREIIAAAEAAYAHAEVIEIDVWTTVWDSGWFSRKLERYGLGEVATFYAVMEQYLERRRQGYPESTMRLFLADRELAKLLLRLRELFLRLKV